jgi:hypothetical protein
MGCGPQVIRIYDGRGEFVRELCGSLIPGENRALTLETSDFNPSSPEPGGTLAVRVNNQTIGVWDAKDQNGRVVPNGYYTLVFQQTFADGSKTDFEKTVYIEPYNRNSPVEFSARPNIAHSGDVVRLTALLRGAPIGQEAMAKIYAVSGELVRTLTFVTGEALWDLRNETGEAVANGVYLGALDGWDPILGAPARKIVKVAVFR